MTGPIIEGHQIYQVRFVLSEAILAVTNHPLLLMLDNELQPTEKTPFIRLQGHQSVLCVHILSGTWLDYL